MAWAWSHTAEAYGNAHDNLVERPPEWLLEAMVEWRIYNEHESDVKWMVDEADWGETRQQVKEFYGDAHSLDLLIESVWDLAQSQATCDNGGFNAWMCPYGCHTVPFDRDEEE